ncbi:MAG: hypothetical protein GY858_04375, partial [Candidatus Omnitrophica bacterium]|nr:hypothetical protein [Candidatus Omnitrophota bacterium]
KKLNTCLVQHFNSKNHSIADLSINILQVVTSKNGNLSQELLDAENYWIRLLNTAFPYGLNDRISGYGNATEVFDPIICKSHPFFGIKVPRGKRGHGKPHRTKRKVDETVQNVYKKCQQFSGDLYKVYVYLRSLRKSVLKSSLNQLRIPSEMFTDHTLVVLLLGYLAGYFGFVKPSLAVEKPFRLMADFPNKGMELVQFQTIFKDRSLLALLPVPPPKRVAVTFQFEKPIRTFVCNYSTILRGLTVNSLGKILASKCSCADSEYCYKPFGHVITGNLDVISHEGLQNLLRKGAKYRLPKKIDWKKVRDASESSLEAYLIWYLSTMRQSYVTVGKFRDRFMEIVDQHIFRFRRKVCSNSNQLYSYREYKALLKKLHDQFVVCVADKAANNFVFVCKKYYLQVLCEELGVYCVDGQWSAVGNSVYISATNTLSNIITRHIRIAKYFNISISENCKKLPMLFAIPKLHKTPFKWRFIAGAKSSTMKALGLLLHYVLRHIRQHFANYDKVVSRY